MIFGQIHYITTWFLPWMMEKGMEEEEEKEENIQWRIERRWRRWWGGRGRRGGLRGPMENRWIPISFLNFLRPSCSAMLVLETSLLLYTMILNRFGVRGGNSLNIIQWEEKLYHFLFQIHSFPFPSEPKLHINGTEGKKKNLLIS